MYVCALFRCFHESSADQIPSLQSLSPSRNVLSPGYLPFSFSMGGLYVYAFFRCFHESNADQIPSFQPLSPSRNVLSPGSLPFSPSIGGTYFLEQFPALKTNSTLLGATVGASAVRFHPSFLLFS
jgi:hypothetical protein